MDEQEFKLIEDRKAADAVLQKELLYIDTVVNKNYLINLNKYPLSQMSPEDNSSEAIRLVRVEKIVYNSNENTNDKLISVYNALYNIQASTLLLIRSSSTSLEFYLGVRSLDNAPISQQILVNSFLGNFPGSEVSGVDQDHIDDILIDLDAAHPANIASVSIVPSSRDEDKKNYVQGIEKFIDTMKGKEYTAIIIADPLDMSILEQRKNGLQNIYSNLSPLSQAQFAYGENDSDAISKGLSTSITNSINNSLTDTTSQFKSRTFSRGNAFSLLGISSNWGYSFASGTSFAHGVTEGTSESHGSTDSETNTTTTGSSRTITTTAENKTIKYILDKVDDNLKRIRSCESFGLWDTACYFVSEDIRTSVMAASTFKALMAGNNSGIENNHVNIWNQSGEGREQLPDVLKYLHRCMNPHFIIPEDDRLVKIDELDITACAMISGNELPLLLSMPRHSIPGVTVLEMAEFGRNVRYSSGAPYGAQIELGCVYHMGQNEPTRVRLDLNSLTSHTFITGSTGSGKSNTSYRILDEMIRNHIPFLVIEPAKGEYKRYYGSLPGIHIYCTNPKYFSMLHINPFRFPDGIHVLEHLDRLIGIFSACWPLYAAMPAILRESFQSAYVKAGWDLNRSIHIPNGHSKYPTFLDVLEALPEIINRSSYSDESKGNYIGSLVTRVRSLTDGISGQVFCSENDISMEDLFDTSAIVDLSRVASPETKSLIMGALIMQLNEYRMCSGQENSGLRHLTVLEEAHNILKATTTSSAEGNDVMAKSVEMISASIAEMRTFGEGFVIVDQSPTAVDASAIKNTNTKIIMRLPDYEDSKIAGLSMGMNDNQIREISRFSRGVAAVYQNNWVETVLCKIDKSEESYHCDDVVSDDYELADVIGKVVEGLIMDINSGEFKENGFPLEELKDIVAYSSINEYKKNELRTQLADAYMYYLDHPLMNGTMADFLLHFVNCDGMFEALNLKLKSVYSQMITADVVSREDKNAVFAWKKKVDEDISNYALINDGSIRQLLVQYLILAERRKHSDINTYHVAYAVLYKGRRRA